MGICEFKPIKIDLKNPSYIYDKKCKQNDTLILNFTVLDDCIAADLTNYSCILNANKNGVGYEVRDTKITKTNNNIRIECETSTTQIAGTLALELLFIDTINHKQKTSFDIEIEIRKSVMADSNGNVPTIVMTQLEHLDESIAKVEGTILKAEQTNNTLNSTNDKGTNTNNALNTSINNANTAKTNCNAATGNLNNAVNAANGTINDLKQANTAYTQHINNADIHATKAEKDKWNAYEAKITELTTIIDDFIYSGAAVTDDDGANVTDDNNENVLM
jgi:hypothetical protein